MWLYHEISDKRKGCFSNEMIWEKNNGNHTAV